MRARRLREAFTRSILEEIYTSVACDIGDIFWTYNLCCFLQLADCWFSCTMIRKLFSHFFCCRWKNLYRNKTDASLWRVRRNKDTLYYTILYYTILYYVHTEKYSPKSYVVNFRTQISSSQSEERTMVFTGEKIIRPIRIANDVFSRVRKMIRPIRRHRGVWVSRQNYRLLLQLAAPLRTH